MPVQHFPSRHTLNKISFILILILIHVFISSYLILYTLVLLILILIVVVTSPPGVHFFSAVVLSAQAGQPYLYPVYFPTRQINHFHKHRTLIQTVSGPFFFFSARAPTKREGAGGGESKEGRKEPLNDLVALFFSPKDGIAEEDRKPKQTSTVTAIPHR